MERRCQGCRGLTYERGSSLGKLGRGQLGEEGGKFEGRGECQVGRWDRGVSPYSMEYQKKLQKVTKKKQLSFKHPI